MTAQQQRTALVTGAGRGIGLACAVALLEADHRVVALDIAAPSPDLFPPRHRERLMPAALDVTDTQGAAALLDSIDKRWGPLGILVNNAGISPKKADGRSCTLMEVTQDEWDRVMRVNLNAAFELSRLAARHMQRLGWGRIVNITSFAGRTRALVAGPSYACSKSALIGLTRSLAAELGPYGITSNSVAPGRILTEMALQAGEQVNRSFAEMIPLKRLGTPQEVAAAVAFLASEGAGFINGALLDVNGGSFMP